MRAEYYNGSDRDFRRLAIAIALAAALTAYVAIATVATLFAPIAALIFFAPMIVFLAISAPKGKCAPKSIILPLMLAAAALMPVWPAYIHIKLGAAPILTPPRILLYIVSAFWLYDMAFSPLRRAQFVFALRRSRWIAGLVMALFGISAASVPMAQGSVLAAQEFIRQAIIWFLPFCAFLTYVRRLSDLKNILIAAALGAGVLGAIAIMELLSGTLLASVLSPFISDQATWLQITQEAKIRDGAFRAQATHTHPLSLGEFLAIGAPLALALCVKSAGWRRAFWIAVFILIVGGVIAANARGALLATMLCAGAAGIYFARGFFHKNRRHNLQPVAGLISLVAIAASPVAVVGAHQMITGEAGTSAARSSQARIDQIKTAWPKIIKRPVGGYGTGRAARIIGYWGRTISVDNYYLSLAVDFGLPGPIIFLSILIISAQTSKRHARRQGSEMRPLLIGLAAAFLAFAVTRIIISQTGNLSYFYLLLGAFAGVNARLKPSAPHSRV